MNEEDKQTNKHLLHIFSFTGSEIQIKSMNLTFQVRAYILSKKLK